MPISSSNQRLTRELYKPPPKSLVELRLSQQQKFHSAGSIGLRTDPSGGLSRERHLDGTPPKRTAVVEPLKDGKRTFIRKSNWFRRRNNHLNKANKGNATFNTNASSNLVGVMKPPWGAAGCCGFPCCFGGVFTRCSILALLLGLLLGALITGLIVGLTLLGEIQARDARIAALERDYQDCFKDPCPTRSSSCGFASNNTEIVCYCEQNGTQQALSAAGYIDGYSCTFFNNTVNFTTPSII